MHAHTPPHTYTVLNICQQVSGFTAALELVLTTVLFVTFDPHMHHPSLIIASHAHHTSSHDTSSPSHKSPWQHACSEGQSHFIESGDTHLHTGIYGFRLIALVAA